MSERATDGPLNLELFKKKIEVLAASTGIHLWRLRAKAIMQAFV